MGCPESCVNGCECIFVDGLKLMSREVEDCWLYIITMLYARILYAVSCQIFGE